MLALLTVEGWVLGTIPRSNKIVLGYSIRNIAAAARILEVGSMIPTCLEINVKPMVLRLWIAVPSVFDSTE